MFDSDVYNDGRLIVGKMSGEVELQSFINGIFWQIDSRNLGDVKRDFNQLYYDDGVDSVSVTEEDVRRIAEINSGIGSNMGVFRTALVLVHPEIIRLARIHQALAKEHGYEVEIFNTLEQGFHWLGCENPDPDHIKVV